MIQKAFLAVFKFYLCNLGFSYSMIAFLTIYKLAYLNDLIFLVLIDNNSTIHR